MTDVVECSSVGDLLETVQEWLGSRKNVGCLFYLDPDRQGIGVYAYEGIENPSNFIYLAIKESVLEQDPNKDLIDDTIKRLQMAEALRKGEKPYINLGTLPNR